MGEEVDADEASATCTGEILWLPKPMTGASVAAFLEPYGFLASTALDWRPAAAKECVTTRGPPSELRIRVSGHSTSGIDSGRHTLYLLECSLWRKAPGRHSPPSAEALRAKWLEVAVARSASNSKAPPGESSASSASTAAEAETE
ncbi:unnamed protein product, partial [Polarella glacialis]